MVAAYLLGLFRAVFPQKIWWWISLFFAYALQIGFFADYARIRPQINDLLGHAMLPETIPAWLLVVPFIVWVFAYLAHDAAKRRVSLKVTFDPSSEMRCLHEWRDTQGGTHLQYRMLVTNRTGHKIDNCRGFVNEICKPDGNGGWQPILANRYL
jgi:hypothetical protein